MEDQEPKHVRRVRYKGTHPKAFKEKYKELQPEIYSEDVDKVMQQGRTPAGMHRSICVDEIMEFLNIVPGQIGLDATLGYGGHAQEMIKRLIPGGHLYALDADPLELPRTKERLLTKGFGPEVVSFHIMNFSSIDQITYESGLLNFVLADLGVSSMQIDNGVPASDFLKNIQRDELEELLLVNSDEPHYIPIAKAIVSKVSKGIKISTTTQLKQIIQEALDFLPENIKKEEIKKSCQRTFQALRIAINDEFGVLDTFLEKLPYVLAPGGRVAILSFHSGEDRRVKKSFQSLFRAGVYSEVAPDPIRPSVEESASNPRARTAKLRWAIRL